MTPKQQKLNALQFELSRRFDAAKAAQRALMAEQRRQKLPIAQQFLSLDEVEAERLAWRIETRGLISAAICEARLLYDANYRPDKEHEALINLGRSIVGETRAKAAPAANVVPMATARQIVEAGRKRRGG